MLHTCRESERASEREEREREREERERERREERDIKRERERERERERARARDRESDREKEKKRSERERERERERGNERERARGIPIFRYTELFFCPLKSCSRMVCKASMRKTKRTPKQPSNALCCEHITKYRLHSLSICLRSDRTSKREPERAGERNREREK